jgi:hypothetical protein
VLQEFSTAQKKNLVVKDAEYQLIVGHLYKMGTDSILRRCVLEHERPRILVEAHEGMLQENPPTDKWISSWILDPYNQDKKVLTWTLTFLFMKLNYSRNKKKER